MPRTVRTLAAAALAAAALIALPAGAAHAAGTTTINFDDLPVNTQVTDQYAAQGVRFGSYTTFGFPQPDHTIQPCGGGQISTPGISGKSSNMSCANGHEIDGGAVNMMFEFEDPRKSVSYKLLSHLNASYPIYITEYNAAHQVVGGPSIGDRIDPGVVKLVSDGTHPTADITYVSIVVDYNEAPNGATVLIDDISAPIEDGRTPQYSLAVQAPSVDTYEQTSVDVPISVRRFGGSVGPVPFSAGALPNGIAGVQFTPPSVTGRDPANMRVSVGGPLTGDRQVAVSVPANVGGAVGSGAITQGVATVHVEPALKADETPSTNVYVPNCAQPGPTYFTVRGDFTGTVFVQPLGGSISGASPPGLASGDPQAVHVDHAGVYTINFPFQSGANPNASGTLIQPYTLTGYGISPLTVQQRIDQIPVKVTGISTTSMPDTQTQIVVRGSFPRACDVKFYDGLNQEWPIVGRDYDSATGTDIITLGVPAGLPAVTVPGGFSVRGPAGQELARTPTLNVFSFRNTAAIRQPNSGAAAGTTSYTWDDFVGTWGRDDTYNCFVVCVRDSGAEKFWQSQQVELAKNDGLCWGIAVTDLLFNGYKDNVLRPDIFEAGARTGYDLKNFAEGTAIKKTLVANFEHQYDANYLKVASRPYPGAASMTQRVADQKALLKTLLARYGGALVHFYDPKQGGHAVAAYRETDNADGGFTIDIADPNLPYQDAEQTNLTLRQSQINTSKLVVKGDGTWSGSSTGWSGDMMSLQVTDAWPIGQGSLTGGGGGDSRADAAHGDIAAITTGGKDTLNPDGTPLKGSPVSQYVPETGSAEAAPLYTFAKGRSYAVQVKPDAGGTLLTNLGAGAGVVVSDPKAKAPGAVTLTPGVASVSYAAGGGVSGAQLSLIDDTGANAQRTADLTVSASGKGSTDAKLAGGALTVGHDGPGTSTVGVALGSVGAGLPSGVGVASMRVGSGQTLTLTPASWTALGGGRVKYVVKNARGKVVKRGNAKLRASRVVGLSGVSAKVKRGTVTITGRVTKRGSSPLLAGAVEVLGAHGKVKSRKATSLTDAQVKAGKFTLTVKVPGAQRGAKLRVTATLVDQAAGVAGGSIAKVKTLKVR